MTLCKEMVAVAPKKTYLQKEAKQKIAGPQWLYKQIGT